MNVLNLVSSISGIVALALGALLAYLHVKTQNEILQLRIYVSDHYVSKDALDRIVARLEKLIEKLESKLP